MPERIGHISEEGHQWQASWLGLLSAGEGCVRQGCDMQHDYVCWTEPCPSYQFHRQLKGEQGATDSENTCTTPGQSLKVKFHVSRIESVRGMSS